MSRVKVLLQEGDNTPVEFASVDEFGKAVEEGLAALGDSSLTPDPSATAEGEGGKSEGQLAMALCATCSHSQSPDHPDDGPCQVSWFNEDKVQRFCRCAEFWPYRPQREDGYAVLGHEVGFGGSVEVLLNRREPTELWDSLKTGRHVTLTVTLEVDGKGFKPVRDKGFLVGVVEVRKLKAERLVWAVELDEETGELL